MLNEREEKILRRIAQEHMPTQVMNPGQATGFVAHPEGDTIPEKLMQLPKMAAVDLNDDPAVEARLRSAGMKDQKPGSIYALGISRREILTLCASELKDRVETARSRAAAEAPEPRAVLNFSSVPKPAVPRVVMVG